MSFTPYSLQISIESRTLYSYQFVEFNCNEHLLSGIISALRMLYTEIFKESLYTARLENYDIIIQELGNIDIMLIFVGNSEYARMFLTELMDKFCQYSYVELLEEIGESSIITTEQVNKIDDLVNELPSYTDDIERPNDLGYVNPTQI